MITTNIPKFRNNLYRTGLFKEFYNKYSSIVNKHFNEEDYQGTSCYYSVIEQYWLAFIFIVYIKKRLYFGETLAEIEEDFNMSIIRHQLSCNGINIYKLYDVFEISY